MKDIMYSELIDKEYHIVKINDLDVDKYRCLIDICLILENNKNIHMFVDGTIREFNFSTIRKFIRKNLKERYYEENR